MSEEKNIARQKFDEEFDEFLRDDDSRLAALYRKLPRPEPDAQLDARVRALAQRTTREPATAAATTAQTAARRYSNRLPVLGAAAAFLLAAGIAWRIAPQMWSGPKEVAAPAVEMPLQMSPATSRATAPMSEVTGKPGAPVADSAASNTPASATEAFPAKSSAPQRQAQSTGTPPMAGAPARRESSAGAASAHGRTAEAPAKAFPAAPARSQESARDKLGKVENAASEPPAALAAPVPAPATSALRIDENEQKQRVDDRSAAPQTVLNQNAAKYAPAPAPLAAPASAPQSTCPAALRAKDWHGAYPPDIPPSAELRFGYVLHLLQQGHRELALAAYTDFHEHCPGDQWQQDLLDQLGLK